MRHRKVLVTGAEGFIGSHVVELLVAAGFCVRAHVLYNSFGNWGWLDSLGDNILNEIEVFLGDLRDPGRTLETVKDVTDIIHLASLIGIPYSYHAPSSYIETNVIGLLNLLEAVKGHEVQKILHTSTSEVYGSAQYVPIDENHPLVAQSPYAASKIAADHLAISYHRSYNLPITILRPFNTFGPRQSARAIIPTIIIQALSDSSIVLGNCEPTRDFTFVTDTAQAYLRALTDEIPIGEVINIGSGIEIGIGELVSRILAIIGKTDTKCITDPSRVRPRTSEVDRLVCCNDKAQKYLAWRPTIDLATGLQQTVEWFRANQVRFKPEVYNI